MRKSLTYLALALMMALMDCTKEGPASYKGLRIVFNVSQEGTETKASTPGPYSKSNSFGAFGLQTAHNWSAGESYTQYITNAEVRYIRYISDAESFWSPVSEYYWPASGYLHFAAYSPYATFNGETANGTVSYGGRNKGIVITGYKVPARKDEQHFSTGYDDIVFYNDDIMVAEELDDEDYKCEDFQNSSPSATYWFDGVRTLFKHVMTKLNFRLLRTQGSGASASVTLMNSTDLENLPLNQRTEVMLVNPRKASSIILGYSGEDKRFVTGGSYATADDVEAALLETAMDDEGKKHSNHFFFLTRREDAAGKTYFTVEPRDGVKGEDGIGIAEIASSSRYTSGTTANSEGYADGELFTIKGGGNFLRNTGSDVELSDTDDSGSRWAIYAATVIYDQEIVVTGIKLKGIYTKGTYTARGNTWGSLSEVNNDAVLFSDGIGTKLSVSSQDFCTGYLAMPQALADEGQMVEVNYRIVNRINGYEYRENITQTAYLVTGGQDWTPGREITYTLTMSVHRDPIEFTASCELWEEGKEFTLTGN